MVKRVLSFKMAGRGIGSAVVSGKHSSSRTDLKANDIDWRLFGLDLDVASSGCGRGVDPSPPPPIGPGAYPPGQGRLVATRKTSNVRLESITKNVSQPPPFDSVDLSHLKSAVRRNQCYTENLPSLQALLEERGVDYSRPSDRDVQLPLEAFEDTTLCTRTPKEWHMLMNDRLTGQSTPLAARALKLEEDGTGRWQDAVVLSWDQEAHRYKVRWQTGTEDLVLSLHVFIIGDDPVLFAARLSKALQSRRYAKSLLKYNFFIDSMPEDRTRKIGRESIAKIATKAKSGLWDANNQFADKLDRKLEQLVEDAQKEYGRVQNKMSFDKVHAQGGLSSLPVDLTLPPPKPPKIVPYLAVKVLPGHDPTTGPPCALVPRGFGQAFEWFCAASLLIRPEVCAALRATRGMCLDLLTERVFETTFASPMRNQEFSERQSSSIMRLKGRLGMWVNTIRMRVTHCLQQATEKWYQLNETSLEVYRASRLRLLLVTCRLMMSNAFLLLGEDNLKSYVNFFSSLVPLRIEIPGGKAWMPVDLGDGMGSAVPLKRIQSFFADPKA